MRWPHEIYLTALIIRFPTKDVNFRDTGSHISLISRRRTDRYLRSWMKWHTCGIGCSGHPLRYTQYRLPGFLVSCHFKAPRWVQEDVTPSVRSTSRPNVELGIAEVWLTKLCLIIGHSLRQWESLFVLAWWRLWTTASREGSVLVVTMTWLWRPSADKTSLTWDC